MNIVLSYPLKDLKEIHLLSDGRGLDLRFNNYPHEDISVETTEWTNIQEFLEWYRKEYHE